MALLAASAPTTPEHLCQLGERLLHLVLEAGPGEDPLAVERALRAAFALRRNRDRHASVWIDSVLLRFVQSWSKENQVVDAATLIALERVMLNFSSANLARNSVDTKWIPSGACGVAVVAGLLQAANPLDWTQAGEILLRQCRSVHPALGMVLSRAVLVNVRRLDDSALSWWVFEKLEQVVDQLAHRRIRKLSDTLLDHKLSECAAAYGALASVLLQTDKLHRTWSDWTCDLARPIQSPFADVALQFASGALACCSARDIKFPPPDATHLLLNIAETKAAKSLLTANEFPRRVLSLLETLAVTVSASSACAQAFSASTLRELYAPEPGLRILFLSAMVPHVLRHTESIPLHVRLQLQELLRSLGVENDRSSWAAGKRRQAVKNCAIALISNSSLTAEVVDFRAELWDILLTQYPDLASTLDLARVLDLLLDCPVIEETRKHLARLCLAVGQLWEQKSPEARMLTLILCRALSRSSLSFLPEVIGIVDKLLERCDDESRTKLLKSVRMTVLGSDPARKRVLAKWYLVLLGKYQVIAKL